VERLKNLAEEIGGEIEIVEADYEEDVETLIGKVAAGELKFTVADENIAKLLAGYYLDIDVKTPISFSQRLAFGLRSDSPKLLDTLNAWLEKRKQLIAILSNKYFVSKTRYRNIVNSPYYSASSGIISPFDSQIRYHASRLHWDWRFLAALIYQESGFDAEAVSWAGAKGLMQIIPSTAIRFGYDTLKDEIQIEENLKAGTNYLIYLQNYWQQRIPDSTECVKFVLGSYNAGLGHILDARSLSKKYGGKPDIWDQEVEDFVLKKSVRKYYTDPVVKLGYARGFETVNYVRSVYSHYHHYLNKVPLDQSDD
jgi:membrane-bound lytic murein transglycosylase F